MARISRLEKRAYVVCTWKRQCGVCFASEDPGNQDTTRHAGQTDQVAGMLGLTSDWLNESPPSWTLPLCQSSPARVWMVTRRGAFSS